MPRNYLITYPRCGITWTVVRIETLIRLAGPELWPGSTFLRMNHLGFSPDHPIEGKPVETKLIGTQKVFTILRDARQVLTSNWYFIQGHAKLKQKLYGLDPQAFSSLDNFLQSEWAAQKFSNFLIAINKFKEREKLGKVYFYEDILDHRFMYEIPRLLGRPYIVSEDLAIQAHEESKGRVNTFKTDHSAPKKESLDHIQQILSESCILDDYRRRYL